MTTTGPSDAQDSAAAAPPTPTHAEQVAAHNASLARRRLPRVRLPIARRRPGYLVAGVALAAAAALVLTVTGQQFNRGSGASPGGAGIALHGQPCSVSLPPLTAGRCYGSLVTPTPAPTATPTPTATATPTPTPTPSGGGGFKAPLQGLITRGGTPAYDWMLGQVANVSWAELQTSAGAPITANNPLDKAIADVRSWNASHPTEQRGIKLRTGAAGGAPPDLKMIGGAPLTVTDNANGTTTTVGRFWTAPYLAVYADFQAKLAAKYDSVPELREVTWAEPAMVYEEPFRRYSQPVLAAAGWTVALDEQAFTQSLAAQQAWKTTLQDIALNPDPQDPPFTESFLASSRALFGKQLVIGNNSLRSSSAGPGYSPMYAAITAAGAPIYFQTATIARWGDPATTFALAAAFGAGCVEVPGGYTAVPMAVLQAAQAALLANGP